jgi:hypothetical protein
VSTSRPACAAVGALLIALCLAACGSSTPSTSSNANAGAGAAQPGGGGSGFLRDPKVVACLKKEGVTVPSRPRGGNAGPPGGQNGQPPSGQNGQPPSGQNGQPPSGQGRPNRRPDTAQFQKLRAALQKCGVTFQGRPPNGQPPQGGQGTTSTRAS